MQTKKFHIGDVLSITQERLVSPQGINGVYDILSFMKSVKFFMFDNFPWIIADECKPYLIEQFPYLASPKMDSAVGELVEMLKTADKKKRDRGTVVTGWLSKLVSGEYGIKCEEMLDVKPLSEQRIK